MPGVTVSRDLLFEYIGQIFNDEEFEKLCFEFGVELDEIVEEAGEQKYRIDIPANRYDLLCVEGIARAFSIFLKRIPAPRYSAISNPPTVIVTSVDPKVNEVRPYIVTALMENINMTPDVYKSIIDLQEKLHHNICRKRLLVAIGIHDFDTLKPPFAYTLEKPEEIKFRALNQKEIHTAKELMEIYESDTHLKPYLHLIKDKPLYPIIRDSLGTVLSMPPIINGEHSKVTEKSINLFIECTATDLTKANIVLDTLVTMLSQHCKDSYKATSTKVKYPDKEINYPTLSYRKETVDIKLINETIGVHLDKEAINSIVNRMSLHTFQDDSSARNETCISVEIPPTRHDIIHPCDIIEDIAIGFGYSNIPSALPKTPTLAYQVPLNKLTTQLRYVLSQAGFTEALTFALCSMDDETEKILYPRESPKSEKIVQIQNPKTSEFQVVRTTLLPGILKTIASNKSLPKPLQIFEISDVVEICKDTDTGARNLRYLCAVYFGKTPGLEIIHGVLDRIMLQLEIPFGTETGYKLVPGTRNLYLGGRCADIHINTPENNKIIGHLGVIHPDVLLNFELNNPCSALEICIESFV